MPSLSEIAGDERTARMVLSMAVEPEDAVTGRLLATVGGVETLRLAGRQLVLGAPPRHLLVRSPRLGLDRSL